MRRGKVVKRFGLGSDMSYFTYFVESPLESARPCQVGKAHIILLNRRDAIAFVSYKSVPGKFRMCRVGTMLST